MTIMASKDEYYHRIIASLQSDISKLTTEISSFKSTIEKQQKEIEALKTSQSSPQMPSAPKPISINLEKLLLEVKRVCDEAILTNYERLPQMFADRHEFANFCKSTEQKFLSADTFTAYQKAQEIRLKSIEEKLGSHYSLLTINRHNKNGYSVSKSYINLDTIIRTFKNGNLQWFYHILICSILVMLAFHLLSGIH